MSLIAAREPGRPESGRRRELTLSGARTPPPKRPRSTPRVPEGTPAPPQPGLTRQLVGLQAAVRVDPAQHEVVRETAGGRGGARARARRRAAPAHPGCAAPAAAAAASREGSRPRRPLGLWSPRARPRATRARPWPRSRRSSPQLRSSLSAGEGAASSRAVGPDPCAGWGRGARGGCRRERPAPPQLHSRAGSHGVWRPRVS